MDLPSFTSSQPPFQPRHALAVPTSKAGEDIVITITSVAHDLKTETTRVEARLIKIADTAERRLNTEIQALSDDLVALPRRVGNLLDNIAKMDCTQTQILARLDSFASAHARAAARLNQLDAVRTQLYPSA